MYYSQDGCKNHHKHYNQLKAEGQEHYYKGDRTDGHLETMEDRMMGEACFLQDFGY